MEEAMESLRGEKRRLEEWMQNPTTQKIFAKLQVSLDAKQREIVLTPLANFDSALAQEFSKGQVAGMLQLQAMVDMELEMIDIDLANLKEQQDGNEN